MKQIFFLLLTFLGGTFLHSAQLGQTTTPADFSFLVADLKVNQNDGIKICEIQHGTGSTFYGDRFSHGEPGLIAPKLLTVINQYFDEFWTISRNFSEKQIMQILASHSECHVKEDLQSILKDPYFLNLSNREVKDPGTLASYHGCLSYRGWSQSHLIRRQQKRYPGIFFMDIASTDYSRNKSKMSALFTKNEKLGSFKPKWNTYPKRYSPELAQTIMVDLKSELVVIKPCNSCLGNGVIIVDQAHLDETLAYIFSNSQKLKNDPDKSYHYWKKDQNDVFIVEEFFPSDPIHVPHLDNQVYQPTMRVAFILAYDNQEINIHFLGGYWLLPKYPLNQGKTLNDCHKAYCIVPYFCSVEPETLSQVESQLEEALELLYIEMLTDRSATKG